MLFVTVGAQLPFPRLIQAVDRWALQAHRTDVLAQTADPDCKTEAIRTVPFLSAAEFDSLLRQSAAVVSHAGMGTIIKSLELGKPVLVLPRRTAFRETRSDHQVDTARHLSAKRWILSAHSEEELIAMLDSLSAFQPTYTPGPHACPSLLRKLRQFIETPR